MLLTAADSDAGGLQVFSPAPVSNGRVTTSTGNPIGIDFNQGFPLDGIEGQNTAPFISEPAAVNCHSTGAGDHRVVGNTS